jgi:ribosomal protein L18
LVAVLEFDLVAASQAEASAVTDRVREELLKTGRVTLVDRAQIDALLAEQALQQTGCTGQECAVRVGKILGVRQLVAGKVTKVSDTLWQISAQVIDVETSETLLAASVSREGRFLDLLTGGVEDLVGKLTGKSTPAVARPAGFGRAVVVSDVSGYIVLDGQRTGLRTNAIVEAVPEGKHTVVVVEGERSATAEFTVKPGETVRVDLRLELPKTPFSVTSQPAGAEILVDGELAGHTPAELALSLGVHAIVLRHEGFVPLSSSVTAAGIRLTVAATLQPDNEAYRAHETWNGYRWGAVGLTAVLMVAGYLEAQAVVQSNARQASLRDQAIATNDVQMRQSLLDQMDDERKKGLAEKQLSDTSYAVGALALGLVAWLQYHEPGRPEDASSFRVTAVPNPTDRGLALAFAWAW